MSSGRAQTQAANCCGLRRVLRLSSSGALLCAVITQWTPPGGFGRARTRLVAGPRRLADRHLVGGSDCALSGQERTPGQSH
jgi:hypothetical protein